MANEDTKGAAAKAGTAAGKAAQRQATEAEIKAVNAGSAGSDDAEIWAKLPTGKKFYIAKKNFGRSVEGFPIAAMMNNLDTDRPFMSYTIRTTAATKLVDADDKEFDVPAGSNVSIVATSDIKGAIRDAALDPDHVLKCRFTALGERPIGKGHTYIDYDVQYVQNPDGTPKKFPRSSVPMAALDSGNEGIEAAKQIEASA